MIAKALMVSAFVALVATSASHAGPLPADRLQAIVDEAVAEGVPGAVIRVETEDGETWIGAAGVNAFGGDSMAPDSLFRLFSITKTITAATAFTLIDDGALGLDDLIGAWLDASLIADLPNSGDVTVRQLIAQTSGIREYADDRFTAMIRENFARVWTPPELIALAADGEPAAPPGDNPSYYSNTNYVLLGLIIESASGMRLADSIRARVLEPLGAADTYSWGEAGRPVPVLGYFAEGGALLDVSTVDLSMFWAAGDLLSTAEEAAKLLRGILAGDLLSDESRARMTGDFRPLVGRPVEYGYGTFRVPAFTPSPVGHSGEGPGGDALALWWPDDGTIVVILTNLDNDVHVTMLGAVAEALGK
jgi:D-alanyl-D-alanine carboxypeptidase